MKFGKKLRANATPEWQNEYIAYKTLKKLIKEMSRELSSPNQEETLSKAVDESDHPTQEIHIPNTVSYSIDSPLKHREKSESTFKSSKGHLLQNFLDQLDKEIRKFYLFYSSIERELYLQINTLLHRRYKYPLFTLTQTLSELDNLVKVSHITKLFCLYVNDNMTAIKKILKKFDKKFFTFYGSITIKYLQGKLDNPNSDLNYMLQYKLIDEVNALIDDMTKDLKREFKKKTVKSVKNLKTPMGSNSSKIDLRKNEELLIPSYSNSEFNNSSSIDVSVKETENREDLVNKIRSKISELDNYICSIDEICTFRSKIKDWNFYIKNGYTIINNHVGLLHKEAQRSMIIGASEDEETIRKFLKNSDKSKVDKKEILSSENRANILISLMHTFLYMSIYSVAQSTNSEYLKVINSDGIYSGLMMGFSPFAAILSTILLSKWSNWTYKYPMIVSLFLISIGSFLYAFAYNFSSPLMIAIGRFLIGLGSARSVNRRYLIQFIPKTMITQYSYYYVLTGSIGLAAGPIFSYLFLYLNEYNNVYGIFSFNIYTYPGWLGFVLGLVLVFIVFFFYSEPLTQYFHMLEDHKLLKNILSKEEKAMINEIDDRLNEINRENNFSDTNLVQQNIEKMKQKQKSNFSYFYKCFFILFLILFTIRVCNESLSIIFPYYLRSHDYSLEFISLYMGSSYILVLPCTILFKKLSMKYPRERKILIYLLILAFVSSIAILDTFSFNGSDVSVIKFCICMTILIVITSLIESLASSLLAKIIPPDWDMRTINAGFLITIATTIGRTLGALMQTIIALIAGKGNIILVTYSFCSSLFFVIIVLFILNYSEIRVKALARILKHQSFSKV